MQSFLAHLHKGHPQAKVKSNKVSIETPRELVGVTSNSKITYFRKLIFGNVISRYETDGQHGYDASRRVNLSINWAFEIRSDSQGPIRFCQLEKYLDNCLTIVKICLTFRS